MTSILQTSGPDVQCAECVPAAFFDCPLASDNIITAGLQRYLSLRDLPALKPWCSPGVPVVTPMQCGRFKRDLSKHALVFEWFGMSAVGRERCKIQCKLCPLCPSLIFNDCNIHHDVDMHSCQDVVDPIMLVIEPIICCTLYMSTHACFW